MIENMQKISIVQPMIGINTIKNDFLFKMTFYNKFKKKKYLTMILNE